MKIKDKTTTQFKDVKVGEVFKLKNGWFYMRIDNCEQPARIINCVNLSMGRVIALGNDAEVMVYPNAMLVTDGDYDE